MKLPILYKRTSTGAIQSWAIGVDIDRDLEQIVIFTTYGQVDGKRQIAHDYIKEGKNIGKANETSPLKQAELEATARWEKQLKKGYVEDFTLAQNGGVDIIIEGGVVPMLAHRYDQHGDKIKFPAYVQPKLDGHRCIGIIGDDGVATLWSRTRKLITGVPHINRALEKMARETGLDGVFDGELYNHAYKTKFEKLTSFIRTPEPKEGCEIVQYHIYDLADDTSGDTFANRTAALAEDLREGGETLVRVKTVKVNDADEMMLAFEDFLKEGYEGLIVRNATGLYVNKRSYDIQKVKEFADDEFKVIGVETGRGKMADKAIFVCVTDQNVEFRVKMKGALSDLLKYVQNPNLVLGKWLTVQYQGFTGAAGVPRFPIGLRIREDV